MGGREEDKGGKKGGRKEGGESCRGNWSASSLRRPLKAFAGKTGEKLRGQSKQRSQKGCFVW